MLSERMQRRLDALLDEADLAVSANEWGLVADKARAALAIEDANEDARTFLRMAEANLGAPAASFEAAPPSAPTAEQPASFAAGRYQVRKFLGEGGKKRVFLAYDALLDRDVAFALIKTEGLDEVGRQRVTREAQAMGRMGAHPHVVSVFDLGEERGAPYIVTELMGGGDVEGELERAGGPLDLSRSLELAKGVARGLAFAHERGVVHRDLKPGNVWLTSDRVAKIGDFGLAVAEGRSRLTQHGLMVGTFAYMPPEQALGGEATPRSDLYSLGAMLYELVTGRPPFEGDSPTAVISQHLNTAPVAPSWHTEHCPPALEDLILALLAKDPGSRPASASEVLATLEAIDPAQPSRSHSSDSANPLDRLARGVFVGRERELERLRSALDRALAGRGSVVMLVGEPGIGKTRTTQELETYARMRGAKVLWGRAHESSGAPPYWPWVQVGRAWGRQDDPRSLRGRLSERQLEELTRLFPELPGLLGIAQPELQPATDEGAQFRLFDTYVEFLQVAAADAPLVVVLDDLHWADQPTLQLLLHVVRELPSMRLLLVGTYRDSELARTHPLSETLAELNRDSGFLRVALRGLERPDVAAYIAATAGIDPAPPLVDRVHAETEGNPFFLSQVVNLLAEEGALSSASVSDISIPEGVREALGRRLDRLSEEANGLLSYAAVVGRQFSYDTLALLSAHDQDALLRLVEEGLRARVIEETAQAGRYQFTHALMQETLLAELSTTRRVRMHGEVGEALERRLGDRVGERATELAVHFSESAALNSEHAAKAARYSVFAGQQARQRFAWAEAVSHFGAAMQLIDDGGAPEIPDGPQLLIELGTAEVQAGNWRDGWRHLSRAMDLSRQRGDGRAFAEAIRGTRGLLIPQARLESLIDEGVALLGEAEPTLRAEMLLRPVWSVTCSPDMVAKARDLTRTHGLGQFEPELRLGEAYLAHRGWMLDGSAFRYARPDRDRALTLARESLAGFLRSGNRFGALPAREAASYFAMSLGLLSETEQLLADYLREATSLRAGYHEATAAGKLANLLILLGRYEEAEQLLAGARVADYVGRELTLLEIAVARGNRDGIARQLPPPDKGGNIAILELWVHGRRALGLETTGASAEAAAAIAEWCRWWDSLGEQRGHMDSYVADAVVPIVTHGETELLKTAYAAIVMDPRARASTIGSFTLDVARGLLALRLGLVEEAEHHFRTGLEWCEREGCPVEAGRNHQGLAEVAERRRDHGAAMQHLDAAGELFARHGAKLYLDQVIAKKEILKA